MYLSFTHSLLSQELFPSNKTKIIPLPFYRQTLKLNMQHRREKQCCLTSITP